MKERTQLFSSFHPPSSLSTQPVHSLNSGIPKNTLKRLKNSTQMQAILSSASSLILLWYWIEDSVLLLLSYLIRPLSLLLQLPLIFLSYSLRRGKCWIKSFSQGVSVNSSPELTIVLDLDETLIHTTEEPPLPFEYDYFTITDTDSTLYYVYKRPYLDYFLKSVSVLGRVIIFTASKENYATQVIANIGQEAEIVGAYYRDVILEKKLVMQNRFIRLHKEVGKHRTRSKKDYCY